MHITTPPQEKSPAFSIPPLPPILLFFSTMGVLYSMLQITHIPQPFGFLPPAESFRVLLNLLFTVSESLQSYQYTHFAVSVPPQSYPQYITVAVTIISVTLAVYIFTMRRLKNKYMTITLFLLVAGVQIYFGVFAIPVWNITFAAAVAWHLLPKANPIAFTGLTAVVVALTLLLFPGESPTLAQFSENIRDQFGTQVERPADEMPIPQQTIQQPDYLPLRPHETGQNPVLAGGMPLNLDPMERFTGSQIGTAVGQRIWLLWLIGLAFALGFLAWFVTKLVQAAHSRKIFNSPDCNLAIDSMFRYAVAWLAEFGAVQQGATFSSYDLEKTLPSYPAALALWQQAVYSNHPMTETDKAQMREFLQETKVTLRKGVSPFVAAQKALRLYMHTPVGTKIVPTENDLQIN